MKNEPSILSEGIQWIITAILVSFIWYTGTEVFDEADDYYTYTSSLDYMIEEGDYAQFYSYYDMANAYYDEAVEDLGPYKEFYDFYNNYVMYVQYDAYIANVNDWKYIDEKQECYDNMIEIYENTSYKNNTPHYKYILEELVLNDIK